MNIEKRELEVRLKHAKILIEKREIEVRLKYAKMLIENYKKEVESLKEEIDKLKNYKTVIDESDFNKLKEFFDIDMNGIDSIEKFLGRLEEEYCPSEFGLIDYDCHDGCDKCWGRIFGRIIEKDGE